MATRPLTLKIQIPTYAAPRKKWRLEIHKIAFVAARRKRVRYKDTDRLELHVHIYFNRQDIKFHDVDNRLKDVMDALQGRAGGSRKKHNLSPVIPNDAQIWRVMVTKSEAPWQGFPG
jgi:Holliday junction resolvase RusA-like endonuclease